MDDDFEQYFLQALPEALTERDRRIVELRYGFAGEGLQTLQQVGDVIGVSRERMRRIGQVLVVRERTTWTRPEHVERRPLVTLSLLADLLPDQPERRSPAQ